MDDEMSSVGSSVDSDELSGEGLPHTSAYEKQRASLETYLKALPYECESVEDMQDKLEAIIGKILICARTQNWLLLSTWDSILHCWLVMRYPVKSTTRVKLAKFYYELCLMPGIEARLMRSWADMMIQLIGSRAPGKRKIEVAEMELNWKPLWRVLQKELWPKKKLRDDTRNVVNILLYLAEESKWYYPPSQIPEMLETFVPLITQDFILHMIPVLTCFLPPTHTHLYLPMLYKFWEAFNSALVDDRLIDLSALITEEHAAGPFGSAGEDGGAKYKDVGIWNESEWTFLMEKCLDSLNLPVGTNKGANPTASHADASANSEALRIKKNVNRAVCFAKIIVYSIAVDGPVRADSPSVGDASDSGVATQPSGYLAGSKALDSLDRLLTSTESFFHPSNVGPWTYSLTSFVHRLASEFNKRWKEEELPNCKIPKERRLTPAIKHAFITSLRTPSLLAMFSKDPISLAYAQGALRAMALLEPGLVMPQLLERTYGGLEVVNETHRTTAVLSMLSGLGLPLSSEKLWVGGQKHIVPLLELCIPGIDMNDPIKTICTTMFICAVLQYVKVGDLSMQQSGVALSGDTPPAELMIADKDEKLPNGIDYFVDMPSLDKAEERALTRDSTAAFADWVVSFFRRVFALFENLPEEGGKKNTTGGKSEEAIMKSVKSTLDIICLHLSDSLFDLVLKLVYDYATTNAKSNAVRAFGQLVACLARTQPEKTITKFLPFCMDQIREELKHGASSVPSTSSHEAAPSDTTLHWNIGILRGCLGYGGATLLKFKTQLFELMILLVEMTRTERGFSSTGRLINRVICTISGVYTLNNRFVNTDKWESADFNADHNLEWGKLYTAEEVKVEWHVPSDAEVSFVLEIIEQVAGPALDRVETLMKLSSWDAVARNDFCRYLNVARSIWSGLPTLIQEGPKKGGLPSVEDFELPELLVTPLAVQAGFTLTDPNDPQYSRALGLRERYGSVLHRAATALREKNDNGEDRLDAILMVARCIDVYLLEYGISRGSYTALQKNYTMSRDLNRTWSRQKENTRLVFIKRAQVYHSSRVYMHALYRRRSALDDQLIADLAEWSVSPYTRIRKHAQTVLRNAFALYVRSTRLMLPFMFATLSKGTDPDRMKGALYVLSSKGTAAYAISDAVHMKNYLLSILECQHQEKPSIQKLVSRMAAEALSCLGEDVLRIYSTEMPPVTTAILDLEGEISMAAQDLRLLQVALDRRSGRNAQRERTYSEAVAGILSLAGGIGVHWRYREMGAQFLLELLRRDCPPQPEVMRFFVQHSISPHPLLRFNAQEGVLRMMANIKIRTYSRSEEDVWLDEWLHPSARMYDVIDSSTCLKDLQHIDGDVYIDKIPTGFVAWTSQIKGYAVAKNLVVWSPDSLEALDVAKRGLDEDTYFSSLLGLWAQESDKDGSKLELRQDNMLFIKTIAKMYGARFRDVLLEGVEPLWKDADRFKQRAAVEVLAGLLRGLKHWPEADAQPVWSWLQARLDQIFNQIKPDTLTLWEGWLGTVLVERDPRRVQPLIHWAYSLPIDFHGDSAFTMTKTLSLFLMLVDSVYLRFTQNEHYMKLFFDNAHTGYAEVRTHLASQLDTITRSEWQPSYPSVQSFLAACNGEDPLKIREAKYGPHLKTIIQNFPDWRQKRLSPPRVNQSQYDKVGLTLLQWIWTTFHGAHASTIFPYVMPLLPEILQMAELNDSSELQIYSSAVLYALSAVTSPLEYIDVIADRFVESIRSSKSWRIRLHALPTLVVFFYRSLMRLSASSIAKVMEVLLLCLADENIEVREMAAQTLSGVLRCSQRQSIIPLKERFISIIRKTKLPKRTQPEYATSLRNLHSAILGLCALVESFPYTVEPWLPPILEILADHASDPPPISNAIRNCASAFKKTHQDTWHADQLLFNEDQLQSLSSMLVGTSYYA